MLQKPRCGTIFRLTRSANGIGAIGYAARPRRLGQKRIALPATKIIRRTIVRQRSPGGRRC